MEGPDDGVRWTSYTLQLPVTSVEVEVEVVEPGGTGQWEGGECGRDGWGRDVRAG